MSDTIHVCYDKTYIDDTGKILPTLFNSTYSIITTKLYWGNIIDGFYNYNTNIIVSSLLGNFRIVIANNDNNEYTFSQYFISELDGKCIKIPKNTWFGVNNLESNNGIVIFGKNTSNSKYTTMDSSIFDWYSKR